jgi:hypothetical protein
MRMPFLLEDLFCMMFKSSLAAGTARHPVSGADSRRSPMDRTRILFQSHYQRRQNPRSGGFRRILKRMSDVFNSLDKSFPLFPHPDWHAQG